MDVARPAPHVQTPGRGATGDVAPRYGRVVRGWADDGWDVPEAGRVLRTEVREERPRSAIVRNASPDVGFDRSVNPYRGCEHGCIYCFARPGHAYLDLSPGLEFETKLVARPGIAAVLRAELMRPGYRPDVLAIGTNTDAYQPVERDLRIMREVLGVLAAFRHPVQITTKGALVERDIDLIAPMAAAGLARVGISVTTLDAGLARAMEPRVPSPARRIAAIRALAAAGVPVRVMVSPVIPGLNDHEVEGVLAAAREAGAVAASSILLRLPLEVAPLFRDWLEQAYPRRAGKVMARVRELHGGRDYDPSWHTRMTGQGVWADLHARRFQVACARQPQAREMAPLRTDLFRVPGRAEQLSLF